MMDNFIAGMAYGATTYVQIYFLKNIVNTCCGFHCNFIVMQKCSRRPATGYD